MSFERFDISVPRFEITEFWLSRLLSWFFQGVSTFCRLATIEATVWLTLKPVPLVGDPKLSPTVPIAASLFLPSSAHAADGPLAQETDWKVFTSTRTRSRPAGASGYAH
jgi:hypothetical protein